MTVTRADFRRLLPVAVGGEAFVEAPDAFHSRDAQRAWRIAFEPLPELRIGLIRLERHRVSFAFEGHTDAQAEAFMARFELYFRRGGG